MSEYLSPRELRGLCRVGDLMIPSGYGLPGFSESGCVAHIDELMAATPAADVRDFKLLMRVISVTPKGVLRWLLHWISRLDRMPAPLSSLFRLLHLGLGGVIFSLYYSGKGSVYQPESGVYAAIGYSVQCSPLSLAISSKSIRAGRGNPNP